MYRHFPSLDKTSLSHDLIQQAASLNISSCSESTLLPLMQLFQPCEPIGRATFTTAQLTTSTDSTHHEYASPGLESASTAPAGLTHDTADPAASSFTASGLIPVEIRPGLAALTSSQRSCQLTDVFALSSSSVDVYISARDTADTLQNYQCRSEGTEIINGVNWTSCRCDPKR
jgi:hypothetical protein